MDKKIRLAIFILVICLNIGLAYSLLFAETISYSRYHIVKRGESLYGISKRYGVSWREIKERNNLSGIEIYPGQKLIIPVKIQGIYHTVKRYETLWRISKTYGISQKEICRLNHILEPTQIKIDQRIFIPGAKKVKELHIPEEVVLEKEKVKDSLEETIISSKETVSISEETMVTYEETISAPEQIVTPSESISTLQSYKEEETFTKKITFSLAWPLEGEVIRYFEEGSSGIDIVAPEGTSIVAPADGKVHFNGWLRGYGKTLIIKHNQLGIYTCYMHNSLNLVEIGDEVNIGDPIAKIGSTGTVKSTLLHFEVRKTSDGKPVNPLDYLP